ncbi:hypothetical protein ACAX43_11235 [Paraburkholderia sp. IW21]|uniref:hypothetical protein n=1 Tax=Paraburkholderia sp. IW21 TaxID=3242488 RepID=UPI0035215637
MEPIPLLELLNHPGDQIRLSDQYGGPFLSVSTVLPAERFKNPSLPMSINQQINKKYGKKATLT